MVWSFHNTYLSNRFFIQKTLCKKGFQAIYHYKTTHLIITLCERKVSPFRIFKKWIPD